MSTVHEIPEGRVEIRFKDGNIVIVEAQTLRRPTRANDYVVLENNEKVVAEYGLQDVSGWRQMKRTTSR